MILSLAALLFFRLNFQEINPVLRNWNLNQIIEDWREYELGKRRKIIIPTLFYDIVCPVLPGPLIIFPTETCDANSWKWKFKIVCFSLGFFLLLNSIKVEWIFKTPKRQARWGQVCMECDISSLWWKWQYDITWPRQSILVDVDIHVKAKEW